MMSEEQFQRLKDDIKKNGQRESIVAWKGLIVDGRNRLRACEELGIEPEIADLMDETDPVAYVISHNLHRRHLTTNQRSVVAAKLATLRHGDNQHSKEGVQNCTSSDDAAELLNVSRRSVMTAKAVIDNAAKAVVDAVESDQMKASLAEKFIKHCPDKREQAKLVKEGAKAVRAFVLEKTPVTTKATRQEIAQSLSKVNAEFTQDAIIANSDAIKAVKSAKNPVVVVSAAIKQMQPDDITAIMLYCEELLRK